ncbi:MAG: hypothetical protein R3F12_09980 [Lysobacteraceae bacterium]
MCVLLAADCAKWLHVEWLPGTVFWGVALIDLSLWTIAAFPFVLAWMSVRRMFQQVN